LLVALAATLAIGLGIAGAASADDQDTLHVAADGEGDDCTAEDPCGSISQALAIAEPGTTVVVREGTYHESFTIDQPRVTVCATDDSATCGDASVTVTGDASTGYVATLQAPQTHLHGLTIDAGQPLSGVDVRGQQATVDDNRIRSNRTAGETGIRTVGVNVVDEDATVRDNEIRGWIVSGIGVWSHETTITNNTLTANRVGVHLSAVADDVQIDENTFQGHLWAVRLAGNEDQPEPKRQPVDLVLRDNDLGPTNEAALRLEANNQANSVDARLNDWGVYAGEALDARIDDQGTDNTVRKVPFQLPGGSPEPGLIHVTGESELFVDLAAALDAADPGDTVAVPASANPANPTPRSGSGTIDQPRVTVCSTVPGASQCANDIQPEFWQLSHSGWRDAPDLGAGEAVYLDDEDTSGQAGSTSLFPPDGFQIDDVDTLAFDYYLDEGDCSKAAPRIGFQTDTDGDREDEGKIYAYNQDLKDGCPTDEWRHADFTDDTDSVFWNMGDLGPNGVDQATVADTLPGTHQVTGINLEWNHGGIAYIDNQRVNGYLLGERPDTACGFAQVECRSAIPTTPRTVIDGSQATTVLDVQQPDATIRGLTLTWSGTPGEPVELVGLEHAHDTRIADNTIRATASKCEPTTIAEQTGCFAPVEAIDARTSRDVTIRDNRITANATQAVQPLTGGHNGIAVTQQARVVDNLVDGFKNAVKLDGLPANFAATDARMEANALAGSLIGTHVRCDAQDHVIVDNRLEANALGVLACTPPADFTDNRIGPAHAETFRITPVPTGEIFDLRGNDWGAYTCEAIEQTINDKRQQGTTPPDQRFFDDGDNTIRIAPYHAPGGQPVPAAMDPTCPPATPPPVGPTGTIAAIKR
jgi:nitrous oxidase accessory protein NosD